MRKIFTVSFLTIILFVSSQISTRLLAQSDFNIDAASYLGDTSSVDEVVGARIQSSGTIVLAANIGTAKPGNVNSVLLNGASTTSSGAIVRLSADGKKVLSVTRVASRVLDLALDASDNIYIAAATGGLIKLNSLASALTWTKLTGSHVHRVDASSDSHVVALVPSNIADADVTGGSGTIYVFNPTGGQVSSFSGHRNTLDVAIDGVSKTVIHIGWRQANAFDGTKTYPVQISYIRGRDYNGNVKWTNYDWSTDSSSPDFINKPENNMADTRGYRCSIGRDGKLYCAFEVAGGNHIFRYSPTNITQKVSIVGGDKYHAFYNTKSEHKTFFARYEPSTGAYLLGQQFTNRNTSGAGNTVRMIRGEIRADETGKVYLGGSAASGLPLTFDPLTPGTYTGGAWFMVMSADFKTRLYVTRLSGGGQTRTTDARTVAGSVTTVWGGRVPASSPLHTESPIQSAPAGGTEEGFFAVITSQSVTNPPTAVTLNPTEDAYVRDGSYANTNYGLATELVSKQSSTSYNRHAYLKFDISSVSGSVSNAKLRVYGSLGDQQSSNAPTAVYTASNVTWSESTITWSNKPATSSASLASVAVTNSTPTWYELDVTAFIQAEKAAGRNTVTLALKNTATSTPYVTFNSSEGANKPELVIDTESASSALAARKASSILQDEEDKFSSVSFFPNPAREKLIVRFSEAQGKNIKITLFNQANQRVLEKIKREEEGSDSTTLDLSTIPDGMYFISIEKDGKKEVKRIFIIR